MKQDDRSSRDRWAALRFSLVGPLLAAPPKHGELAGRLEQLSQLPVRHPVTGEPLQISPRTLERWYQKARQAEPAAALRGKPDPRAGQRPSLGLPLREAIRGQWREHPSWTYRLHYKNLAAQVEGKRALGALPSYETVRRYMREVGLIRIRKRHGADGKHIGEPKETRSYEVAHVGGLWHSDFHEGSRRVLTPQGSWEVPLLFAVIDDHSRLCCHLQWYLSESAETFCHGLMQAFLKRGLPRMLLTDNGGAMTAAETEEGLRRLSICHPTTLPEHAEQNAKVENFWTRIEGEVMPMLEGEKVLTLRLLNEATQAWAERDYHRAVHGSTGKTPVEAFTSNPSVMRPAPEADTVRRAFRREATRSPRRSDGTVSIEGIRYELPWQYRAQRRVTLRYARWDLESAELVDPHSKALLAVIHPLDARANADGRRRPAGPDAPPVPLPEPTSGIGPHMRKLMREHAASGQPSAYLPLTEKAERVASRVRTELDDHQPSLEDD